MEVYLMKMWENGMKSLAVEEEVRNNVDLIAVCYYQ
jgi:hypothetical protein